MSSRRNNAPLSLKRREDRARTTDAQRWRSTVDMVSAAFACRILPLLPFYPAIPQRRTLHWSQMDMAHSNSCRPLLRCAKSRLSVPCRCKQGHAAGYAASKVISSRSGSGAFNRLCISSLSVPCQSSKALSLLERAEGNDQTEQRNNSAHVAASCGYFPCAGWPYLTTCLT